MSWSYPTADLHGRGLLGHHIRNPSLPDHSAGSGEGHPKTQCNRRSYYQFASLVTLMLISLQIHSLPQSQVFMWRCSHVSGRSTGQLQQKIFLSWNYFPNNCDNSMLLCPGLRWCVWLSTGKYFKEAISTLRLMIDFANICPVGDWDRGRGRRMPWGWKWGTASRRSTGTTSAASRRSTGPGVNWSKIVIDRCEAEPNDWCTWNLRQ